MRSSTIREYRGSVSAILLAARAIDARRSRSRAAVMPNSPSSSSVSCTVKGSVWSVIGWKSAPQADSQTARRLAMPLSPRRTCQRIAATVSASSCPTNHGPSRNPTVLVARITSPLTRSWTVSSGTMRLRLLAIHFSSPSSTVTNVRSRLTL